VSLCPLVTLLLVSPCALALLTLLLLFFPLHLEVIVLFNLAQSVAHPNREQDGASEDQDHHVDQVEDDLLEFNYLILDSLLVDLSLQLDFVEHASQLRHLQLLIIVLFLQISQLPCQVVERILKDRIFSDELLGKLFYVVLVFVNLGDHFAK